MSNASLEIIDLFDDAMRSPPPIPASSAPPPRARTQDPATSHAAAASMRSVAGDQHRRILWALQKGGAATIHELAYRCIGLDHVAIARRLPELEEAGKVRPTGEERPGPNGRACRVWVAL